MVSIGDEIRAGAKGEGMTIAELAKRLGMSRSHLHRVLSGSSRVTKNLAGRMSGVINLDVEKVLKLQAERDAQDVKRGR